MKKQKISLKWRFYNFLDDAMYPSLIFGYAILGLLLLYIASTIIYRFITNT